MDHHRSGGDILMRRQIRKAPSIAAALSLAVFMFAVSPGAAHEIERDAAGHPHDAAGPMDPRLAHLPHASDLPAGVERISPHIPGMGEHWANPRDLPLGPVYCVMDGRVTCMEFMIAQQAFRDGESLDGLRPWFAGEAPQPPVDHMNLDYMPKGHPGFEAPHYDMHMYFVPAELLEQDKTARQAAG